MKRWIVVAALALAAGCSPPPPRQVVQGGPPGLTAPTSPPPPLPIVRPNGQEISGQGQGTDSPDVALQSDPSAVQLDNIVEAILLYLKQNGGMPGTLQDLSTVPIIGPSINANSPSGAPYAYIPQGLTAPGSNKRLVVYDPLGSTDGRRWCILVSQTAGGGPLTAEVMHLPEVVFRTYLVSGER